MASEKLDLEDMTLEQLRQKELEASVASEKANAEYDYWIEETLRLTELKNELSREIAKREDQRRRDEWRKTS